MTRIAIFGAGAIGGILAARLARAGEADVGVVARGAHLAAIRQKGLTLKSGNEAFTVPLKASADARDLGVQDYVIVALKAQAITGALDAIAPLLGPQTAVLFAQNGIPWWYFHGIGGAYEGTRLESVDPGGAIWDRVGPQRALGAVVWQAAHVESPGVIVHEFGERMPIAEPDGTRSARAETLSRLLTSAGIKSPVRGNLRDEIWLKLWGNLSFNPVSLFTRTTLAEMASDEKVRPLLVSMMQEAQAIATHFGIRFAVDIDERIAMAARVGAHKSSMLQDFEAGRPTEIDALLGVVLELASLAGIPAPTCADVYRRALEILS